MPIARRPRVSALMTPLAIMALGAAALAGCNPNSATEIGTFTPSLVNGDVRYSAADIAAQAKAVGVENARVQQVVGRPLDPIIGALETQDIQAHLVAKSPQYGRLPDDLAGYKRELGDLLDTSPTPLLAVQNEEAVDRFWLDTPDNYLTLLRAAAEVANARDVPVTNGGIDRGPIALATWNHLRLTRGTAYADQFLDVVFDSQPGLRDPLQGISPSDPDPYRHLTNPIIDRWREAEYLLAHYGTGAGDVPIDYVNFHWYVSDQTGFRETGDYTDMRALADVVTSIEEMTGKPAVTNEIGQWGRTTEAVTGFLKLLRNVLEVPWVFWFDADGMPAQGLHESGRPGVLRPNGEAFARFTADWERASRR